MDRLSDVPAFLTKTYEIVDDKCTDHIVSWGPNNNSFVVWDTEQFAKDVCINYFQHKNFPSFVRQLNKYGFRKVDPDRYEYANGGFLRGQKHLLESIKRKKPVNEQNNQQPQQANRQSSSIGACVEVGKFGLEEEVDMLKRDKNTLMQEVLRLRHQQQNIENQLQSTTQRLQAMEQRQQQMMSFLAKAVHSPRFLTQLLQQQNGSERRITGASKKRSFEPEENSILSDYLSDGQIVKFQPMMNGAEKTVLTQIKQLDAPPRIKKGSHAFLITDSGFTTGPTGVNLQEVPPFSGSFSGLGHGASEQNPSNAMSNFPFPSLGIDSEMVQSIVVGEQNMASLTLPQIDSVMHELSPPQMIPESSIDMENTTLSAINNEQFFNDFMNLDFDWDGALEKLPEIDDISWNRMLSSTQQAGENEEVELASTEISAKANKAMPFGNGWDKAQDMEHFAVQMGHLI